MDLHNINYSGEELDNLLLKIDQLPLSGVLSEEDARKAIQSKFDGIQVTAVEGDEASITTWDENGNIHVAVTLPKGADGSDGADGKSAYELAVEDGYTGDLQEWLASLKGEKGDKGDKGEQGEKGEKGATGAAGADGYTPVRGVDYYTDTDKQEIEDDLSKDFLQRSDAAVESYADTVAMRDADGCISASDPTEDEHLATKQYVDAADNKIQTIYMREDGYIYDFDLGTYVQWKKRSADIMENYHNYRFVYIGGGKLRVPLMTEKVNSKTLNMACIYSYSDGKIEFRWGQLYIDNVYMKWNTSSITEYNPCLIEGTLVQMADGTDKPIEEVCAGDLVKSYNPAAGELVDAVVIDSYITGYARKFDVYSFSGGQALTVFGLHGIYRPARGTTQDIRELTLCARAMDVSGGDAVLIDKRVMQFAGAKKARYNLITSNNLYFAGGILLGQKPFSKFQHILDRGITLPEDIRTVWQSDCDDYNAYNAMLTDTSFFDEVKEINRTVAHNKIVIKRSKKSLADTDYLVNKFTEGVLAVTEWAKAKANRAGWRQAINDSETVLADAQAQLDAVIARYRGDKTPKSIFADCCARDNALFDRVKEYYSKEQAEETET